MTKWLCLAVLALLPLEQDKALRKLEWKLAPGHAAEFVYLDKGGKPLADQKLVVFASELTQSTNRIAVDTYEQIPLALLFQLPPEAIKGSAGWESQTLFFTEMSDAFDLSFYGSLRPVCAKGRSVVKIQKKGDDEIATIEGAFSLVDVRRDVVNSQLRTTITKIEVGTLATSAQFSLSKGMILKAAWQYRIKGQDRQSDRLAQRAIDVHQMLEFKEDVELDPAKIQPAIETSMTRAVEWLKKQQKGGAWTPAAKGGVPPDPIQLTSVAVRALIAAGVKPDDPAVAAASRTLRSTPPQDNYSFCQQIQGLAAKSPTKEEADDLKKFVEELQKRREPRSGGWAPVPGKNDFSTAFLTALALETLAAVPDAKVPEEIFKSGLDFFSGSWIEDDGKVDLDIEFEKDATTLAPDLKKDIVPCTWPAFVLKGNDIRAGRRGSWFTQVAALRVLLFLPERMKLDERGLKSLDLPLRKGLADLQQHWTLRSVYPSEGHWCFYRMEYLSLLGPMLAKAKIEKIAGSDWRLEGASLLLREQGDDGSWFSGTEQAMLKTAQALLFLASARR